MRDILTVTFEIWTVGTVLVDFLITSLVTKILLNNKVYFNFWDEAL
jgi:hypothetical protein